MKAMILNRLSRLPENQNPLEPVNLPDPVPSEKEILIRVSACGVCHTELDEIEGRNAPAVFAYSAWSPSGRAGRSGTVAEQIVSRSGIVLA